MDIKSAYTIVKILYQCCYVDEMNYVLCVSFVAIKCSIKMCPMTTPPFTNSLVAYEEVLHYHALLV